MHANRGLAATLGRVVYGATIHPGNSTSRRLLHISSIFSSQTAAPNMAGGQKVSFPSDNTAGNGEGITFGDPSQTKKGLIVIHEWWGMTEQIQQEGSMISEEGGFAVLVPDLYRGKVTIDREEAGHLMSELDWPGALKDITAGAKYLKARGCTKIGVTGFCMGGALAFAAALHCPDIAASAPFYGIPNQQLADLTNVKIPVQGHFGQKDDIAGFSSPQDYLPLRDKLVAAGVNFELFEYPTGHGFTNPNNPSYSKEICSMALGRMYQFMQQQLQ